MRCHNQLACTLAVALSLAGTGVWASTATEAPEIDTGAHSGFQQRAYCTRMGPPRLEISDHSVECLEADSARRALLESLEDLRPLRQRQVEKE